MKRWNVKKQLKAESDLFAPDPYGKITAAIASAPLSDEKNRRTSSQRSASRRNGAVGIGATAVAAAVCLAIVLPLTSGGKHRDKTPLSVHFSAQESYGLGAVTTAKLLGEGIGAQTLSRIVPYAATYSAENGGNAKAQVKNFNRYFTAFDVFFGEKVLTASTAANTDEAYPFAYKMTIGGKDFNGNAVSYDMYYNETLQKTETDVDETENKYRLEGVMRIEGKDYYLEGGRSEETETDESETELEIRAYQNRDDRSSYIEMSQEISVEEDEYETEYVYSVFQNGKLVETTAIEFTTEKKNGKEETAFELEFRNGDAKGEYEAKREMKNGVAEIKVTYKIDGEKGNFRIRNASGDGKKQYEYLFSDQDSVIL